MKSETYSHVAQPLRTTPTGSNPDVPVIAIFANNIVHSNRVDIVMWPYDNYSFIENLLVLIIPSAMGLLFYIFCRPMLFRKISEKQRELDCEE